MADDRPRSMEVTPGATPAFLKRRMAGVGDFFFKWRNQAFPLMLLAIYLAVPPENTFLGSRALEPVRDAAAALVVAAGLALRALVIGFRYIKRGGVGKKVYAADLVTSGMFGLCRNPLYVGNLVIVLGVLLMHGNPFVFVGGALLMGFIYQSIVFAEERYLLARFGEAYLAYCKDVPRWSIRWSRFAEATEGMRYDLKKAVFADYSTMAMAAGMLAFTELYEQIVRPSGPERFEVIDVMAAVLLVAVVWTAVVRYIKKRPHHSH